MKRIVAATFLLAALLAAPHTILSQETVGKPLLQIVTDLERAGYGPITEIALKKGRWEVEVYKDGTAYELLIDPATGRTLAQHRDDGDPKPPANAKRLSEILRSLEAEGYTRIDDVSFETPHWEVEAYRGGSKRELRVDPVTGKILADRLDD